MTPWSSKAGSCTFPAILWTDKIRSHHIETMGNRCWLVFYRGIIISEFLGWCRILSIHSRNLGCINLWLMHRGCPHVERVHQFFGGEHLLFNGQVKTSACYFLSVWTTPAHHERPNRNPTLVSGFGTDWEFGKIMLDGTLPQTSMEAPVRPP